MPSFQLISYEMRLLEILETYTNRCSSLSLHSFLLLPPPFPSSLFSIFFSFLVSYCLFYFKHVYQNKTIFIVLSLDFLLFHLTMYLEDFSTSIYTELCLKKIFFFDHVSGHMRSQFSHQGPNPHPLHWKHRVLTPGPSRKSP